MTPTIVLALTLGATPAHARPQPSAPRGFGGTHKTTQERAES